YPAQGSGSTGRLAANYVRFIPQKSTGGLRIDPQGSKGNWSFQVACFPSEEDSTTNTDVPGWSRYNEIVLILTETSFKGGPFGYSYLAQFDPELTGGAPAATVLRQNWPNPFDITKSSKTTISFDLRSPAEVILSIYSVNGQLVKREELGWLSPNSYDNFSWNGKDQQGRPVASGIYFYQIKASNFSDTKKMLLIK
ncbi:MAG: T9SS type A sorting domain-containing protein, partial [Candidatus Latescibacteria bacterium]|nr:T9SS type A sorting domain-containing protein [Candidatus Latescibacterota bacterium]